jgi:Tol biopolymer transport system component
VYVPGGRIGPGRRLMRVDATGKSTPLMDGEDAIVGGIAVSPDGRDVAVVTLRKRVELWVYNIDRRTFTLVNAEGESWSPQWTPDGMSLVFTRVVPGRRPEVVRKAVRGGSATRAEPIDITTEGEFYPVSFSPDGKMLLLEKQPTTEDQTEKFVAFQMDKSGGGEVEPISSPNADETNPLLSADGKLLAFLSNESGRYEVYIRAFGQDGPRLQVSAAGGRRQCWSRDGKRLFFMDRRDVMHEVEIETQDGLHATAPTKLFETAGIATTALWGTYDVFPDDSFVMVEPAAWELQPVRLRVVLNWVEELRRMTGSGTGR